MLAFYLQVLDTEDEKNLFEKLYNTYKQDMYAVAYSILHNSHDAEDAVHQSFLRIANNLSKIIEVKCPQTKAFIVIIVKNVSIDIYNLNKGSCIIDDNMPEPKAELFDSEVMNKLDFESALYALKEINENYQEIIYLRYMQCLTVKEISAVLNISTDNVKKRLTRAKSALMSIISKEKVFNE